MDHKVIIEVDEEKVDNSMHFSRQNMKIQKDSWISKSRNDSHSSVGQNVHTQSVHQQLSDLRRSTSTNSNLTKKQKHLIQQKQIRQIGTDQSPILMKHLYKK